MIGITGIDDRDPPECMIGIQRIGRSRSNGIGDHDRPEFAYKHRNLIERTWWRIKDFRRIATRYDKLARNFASSVALAAVIIWWAD
jgi:transposase